ncbi:hypothetical protein DFAR_1760013 [Desulfarculales bacterium]
MLTRLQVHVVASYAVGYDNLDLDAGRVLGVGDDD